MNGVSIASIVECAKLAQKVLRLRVLWFVFEIVVVDGFGAAEIVDANHKRTEVLKGFDRLPIKDQEAHSDEGDKRQSDFEICVRHHGVPVLFEIEPLGILKVRSLLMAAGLQ